MSNLFSAASFREAPPNEGIAPGAVLLRGFALPFVNDVLAAFGDITAQAPFRHMTTPWGAAMSVAMTNCGEAGWLTDRAGYRYDRIDPETGQPWPDGASPRLSETRNARRWSMTVVLMTARWRAQKRDEWRFSETISQMAGDFFGHPSPAMP